MEYLLGFLIASTTTYINPAYEAKMPVGASSVEILLNDTFGENPTVLATMKAIAGCESGHRQYEEDGTALLSRLGTADYGYFQIHAPIWEKVAIEKGWDIHTLAGNIKMAKHILDVQGLGAWRPSRSCWQPALDKL